MPKKRPAWPLTKIRRLAKGDRILLTRAIHDGFRTRWLAEEWVRDLLEKLRLKHFAHSVQLAVHVADVYAVEIDGRRWYVKLTISNDEGGDLVLMISCHPLQHAIQTRQGMMQP